MKNFLIVKTSSLGDIVHAYNAVAALKQCYPSARVTWVVEKPCLELVSSHPCVDEVILVDTRCWRKSWWSYLGEIKQFITALRKTHYDAVFDLQGNFKSGLITALAYAGDKVGFGWRSLPEKINFLFTNRKIEVSKNENIRDDYIKVISEYCGNDDLQGDSCVHLNISEDQRKHLDNILNSKKLLGRKLVVVAPGSNWQNKMVDYSFLMSFLASMEDECAFLFLAGNDHEMIVAENFRSRFDKSIVIEKLPLPVLQNLMAAVDLVVAMDSLPLHLAGTTLTPTFSFFGPSSAMKYAPKGNKHKFYQGSCPYGENFYKRCKKLRSCDTGNCIKVINLEDALKVLYEFSRDKR